jgi:soluble lytic murein transglycosylase-like protein
VAPALALAIVDVESDFNATAVSHSGAIGLMQLMPSTIITMHVTDPRDPLQNLAGGLALLKIYSKRYGTIFEVLAAYHSGAAGLQRHGITASDRDYIRRIVGKWHLYEHMLNDGLEREDPIGTALMFTSPLKLIP